MIFVRLAFYSKKPPHQDTEFLNFINNSPGSMNLSSTTPVTNKNFRVCIELLFTYEIIPVISDVYSLFFNLKSKLWDTGIMPTFLWSILSTSVVRCRGLLYLHYSETYQNLSWEWGLLMYRKKINSRKKNKGMLNLNSEGWKQSNSFQMGEKKLKPTRGGIRDSL